MMHGMFIADILSWLTFFVVVAGFLLFLLAMIPLAAILLGRAAYRRIRRDPRWDRTALLMQEKTSAPGPKRAVAQLRRRLHESMTSARQAIVVLEAHGAVQGELASLVRRLDQIAATVDAQLRLMQSEPNPAMLRQLLLPVRDRVMEIEDLVQQIRMAAYAAINGDTEGTVAALTRDVEHEVAALQAGLSTLRATTFDTPVPLPIRPRKEGAR